MSQHLNRATADATPPKPAANPPQRSGRAATRTARQQARSASVSAAVTAAALLLAACGSSGGTSPSSPASTTTTAPSTRATKKVDYQLHMAFFSLESKIRPVIDPQVFVASPGAKAKIGPQMISHVAGVAPAKQAGPPATRLLAADATPLKVTLGEWERAAGSVAFSCVNGSERAESILTGLIPSATYSTFVVHLKRQGATRFTPWGNAAANTNNFTASSTGAASPTNTVTGCLGADSAAVIMWHSDGQTHGSSPGTIGVTWHNSLITALP